MANSTGTHSYGSVLALDPAGGSTYAAQAEVLDWTGPEVAVTNVNMTNLASPFAYKEFRPGFADGGEVTYKCTWTKANYATLLSNIRTALMTWRETFPLVGAEVTASKLEFAGHIAKLGIAVPEDDRITNDISIKVSGKPVFTSGS